MQCHILQIVVYSLSVACVINVTEKNSTDTQFTIFSAENETVKAEISREVVALLHKTSKYNHTQTRGWGKVGAKGCFMLDSQALEN